MNNQTLEKIQKIEPLLEEYFNKIYEHITNNISLIVPSITDDGKPHLEAYIYKEIRDEQTLLLIVKKNKANTDKGEWINVSWKQISNIQNKIKLLYNKVLKIKISKKPKKIELALINLFIETFSKEEYEILLAFKNLLWFEIEKTENEMPTVLRLENEDQKLNFLSLFTITLNALKIPKGNHESFFQEIKEAYTPKQYAKISTQLSNNLKFNKNTSNTNLVLADENKSIEPLNDLLYQNIQLIDLNAKEFEVMIELLKLANEQELGDKKNYISFKSQRELFGEKKRDLWSIFTDLSKKEHWLAWHYELNGEKRTLSTEDSLFKLFYDHKGTLYEKPQDDSEPDRYVIKFHEFIHKGYISNAGYRLIPNSISDDLREALPKINLQRLQPLHYKFAIWLFTHEYSGTPIKRRYVDLVHELHLKNKQNKLSEKQIKEKLIQCSELLKLAGYIAKYEIDETCLFALNDRKFYHLQKNK